MILLLWEYSEDYPKLSLVFISKVPQLKIKYQKKWNISPIVGNLYSCLNSPNHNSSLFLPSASCMWYIMYQPLASPVPFSSF